MNEDPMSTNHRRSSGTPVKASAPDVGDEREADSELELSANPDDPDPDDPDDPLEELDAALFADAPPDTPEPDDVPEGAPLVDPDEEDDGAGSMVNGVEKVFGWVKSS
jgi:hypothetical protein